MTVLLIGELSKRTGASPKAIRLYEAMGLIGPVARRGVYRVYSEAQLTQVRLIKQAQGLGFSLADVAPAMRGGRVEPDWATLAQRVALRRTQIAQEIVRLQQLDAQLLAIHAEICVCVEPA